MNSTLSPEAYEDLIGQTVDLLTVVDELGVIQYQSPSIESLLGYRPEELVGENAFTYVHPDDQEAAMNTFSEVVESPESYTTGKFDFRFRHEDGSWVWLEGRGSNQTTTAVGGYVISSRDITERKAFEQKLQREQERLERFAAFVSHDLRNPLNVATGRLELALAEYDSEHLDAVERSLDRMGDLLEDVLVLVREGNVAPSLDAVGIRRLAETCWQQVDTKDATLAVETDQYVLADDDKLKHLFENLVRNAVEHAGDDVTVTIGSLDDGFYVADDGPGIPEADRESALEYGFSTKADGTGLGLSIVKEVVENHGWTLAITAGDDGGARFEITGVTVVD